jgi:hypothetical protein
MLKFNPKPSKETCFPKTIVPTSQGIGTSPTNDNMLQQRNIHRSGCFPELPCKLYVGSAWRWVA